MTGFATPLRAELPLDGLEAFRLASFGIEYVPQYGEVRWDADCAAYRWFAVAASDWDTSGDGLAVYDGAAWQSVVQPVRDKVWL